MVVRGHGRVRIAVADREHGAAVLHRPLDEAALRRQIHDVVLVDPRRAAQQRHLVHLRRSAASYCSTSMRSLRYTTLPGVQARLRPTSNGEVSTCRGRPLLCSMSSRKLRHPSTTLRPPVSSARLSTAGLVAGKFVGANASCRNDTRQLRLALLHPVQIGDVQQIQPYSRQAR